MTPESIHPSGQLSDGYHTFDEPYDHRNELFIALCRYLTASLGSAASWKPYIWKSHLHHDGTRYDGWFIAGIRTEPGQQISYHLPNDAWDRLPAYVLERAPEYDGHTSADVLERLKKI